MYNAVRQSTKVIKQLAKQALRGHYVEAVALIFILRVLRNVPGLLIETFAPNLDILVWLADAYYIVVSGPAQMATVIFFIATFRNIKLGLNAIPATSSYFLKSVVLYLLMTIKIMLWSMLFVVPGIFAALRYSQAYYVLADHPEYAPMDCINASKALMAENLGKYIRLRLSYLPLIILASIPAAVFARLAYKAPAMVVDMQQYANALRVALLEVSNNTLVKLLELLVILVDAYVEMGCACFYDIAAGNLVFSTESDAVYATVSEAEEQERSEEPWNDNTN